MIKEVVLFVEEKLQGMGFAYVGVDCGQADTAQPAIKYPAALIDIRGIDVDSALGGRSLKQSLRLSVRVIELVLGNISGKAPEVQRENWFDFAEKLETVMAELHYRARLIPMAYEGMEIRQREDGLREGVINFVANMGLVEVNDSAEELVAVAVKKGEEK